MPFRTTQAAEYALKHALLWHVFEQHKQGIMVDTLALIIRASLLSPEFMWKLPEVAGSTNGAAILSLPPLDLCENIL